MSATDQLTETTSAAVERTLQAYGITDVERGPVREGGSADVAALLRCPGAVVAVDYEGRVSGSTALVLGALALRRIAAAMMGQDPTDVEDDGSAPDELALSAIAEVGNQALAAASTSLGELLEVPVEIGTPTVTHLVTEADVAGVRLLETPRALIASLRICGEPVQLALLMPTAVFVRVESALDRGAPSVPAEPAPIAPDATGAAAAVLAHAHVRLTADVGGVVMALGELLRLPPGAPLVLDADLDTTVTLRANGQPFAHGELVVQHGRWAFRIAELLEPATPTPTPTTVPPVASPLTR